MSSRSIKDNPNVKAETSRRLCTEIKSLSTKYQCFYLPGEVLLVEEQDSGGSETRGWVAGWWMRLGGGQWGGWFLPTGVKHLHSQLLWLPNHDCFNTRWLWQKLAWWLTQNWFMCFGALKAWDSLTETLTGDDWNDGFAEGRFLWEDAKGQYGHWIMLKNLQRRATSGCYTIPQIISNTPKSLQSILICKK